MPNNNPSGSRSYFHDAEVNTAERTYRLSAEECRSQQNSDEDWHGPSDPSTWLAVTIFLLARQRVADAGDSVGLELASQALGITVDRLRDRISWHENYMRWHDDDPSYQIL